MNKKILIIGLLAVCTLLVISFASAINKANPVEKKDSPLFGIRTRLAIRDRLKGLRESIRTRFIGERIFFLPLQQLKKRIENPPRYTKEQTCWGWMVDCTEGQWTCEGWDTCDSECLTEPEYCTGSPFCNTMECSTEYFCK